MAGSYTCSCNRSYELAEDDHGCTCLEGTLDNDGDPDTPCIVPECSDSSDCAETTCQVASCVNSLCQFEMAPDNTECNDDLPCTVNDSCQNGTCGNGPVTCFEDDVPWPLCGLILDDPPVDWVETDGCPSARWGPDYTDGIIGSTFAPRQLPSDGLRYDLHRGLDIDAPIGSPLFALADGVVTRCGVEPGHTDPVIAVRHYRPGETTCSNGNGCYFAYYLHVTDCIIDKEGAPNVVKGQLLGHSGEASTSGHDHLHFEIRNAGVDDPTSAWLRDAIHPLNVLPYHDSGADNLEVEIVSVDAQDPMHPVVTVGLTIAQTIEWDFNRVEVAVWDRSSTTGARVAQPGVIGTGVNIEAGGYNVHPPFFDIERWNRQYTHKSSTAFPWSIFGTGGAHECPFHADHPDSTDSDIHLDAQDPSDSMLGLFNGLQIAPPHTNSSSTEYTAEFRFDELVGVADAADLCVRARAIDIKGSKTPWEESNCD